MSDHIDRLVEQWTRLGAGFNAEPAPQKPDVERLLLATARQAPKMSRLFIMAATWLNQYGGLVAKHRLRRLVRAELAPEHRPVLGLLLEIAQQGTHPPRFASVIADLSPGPSARPLFDVESGHPQLAARAERRASAVSRRWNLWCEPFEFKTNAIRPARWVLANNPDFVTRADFRGDLRASILAALRHDPGAGDSEFQLSRCAGGSRAQVRSALHELELTGRVRRSPDPRARKTRVSLVQAG